eukprot:COSAG01_NODE_1105_length_11671_cov_3.526789_3_plen_91_part_00
MASDKATGSRPESEGEAVPTPPLFERLYNYTQYGDRMYGGTDKLLRFVQYSLACAGTVLVAPRRHARMQFAGEQTAAPCTIASLASRTPA